MQYIYRISLYIYRLQNQSKIIFMNYDFKILAIIIINIPINIVSVVQAMSLVVFKVIHLTHFNIYSSFQHNFMSLQNKIVCINIYFRYWVEKDICIFNLIFRSGIFYQHKNRIPNEQLITFKLKIFKVSMNREVDLDQHFVVYSCAAVTLCHSIVYILQQSVTDTD